MGGAGLRRHAPADRTRGDARGAAQALLLHGEREMKLRSCDSDKTQSMDQTRALTPDVTGGPHHGMVRGRRHRCAAVQGMACGVRRRGCQCTDPRLYGPKKLYKWSCRACLGGSGVAAVSPARVVVRQRVSNPDKEAKRSSTAARVAACLKPARLGMSGAHVCADPVSRPLGPRLVRDELEKNCWSPLGPRLVRVTAMTSRRRHLMAS